MGTANNLAAIRINTLIAERELTQDEVADRAGIPRPTLSRRLSGHSPLNIDELQAIALVLGVPTADLLAPRQQPERVSA